jgi:membrane protein
MNVVKQTLSEFINDDCMRMAASLAYYTIFSLPPLLVIIVTVVGLVLDPQQAEVWLQKQSQNVIGPGAATQIQGMIQSASESVEGGFSLTLIVSLLGVLIGATAAFGELQYALNTVWGIKADPDEGALWSYVMKRILSLGMILVIAFLMLVALILSAVISAVQDHIGALLGAVGMGAVSEELVWIIDAVVSLAIITQLFAAIFKVLPDAEIRWRDVEFGAFITALLFVVGKFLIAFYIGHSNLGEVYGAAAALAVLLIWVYYSSLILLMGAEFTQVWTRRHGRAIRPTDGAVPLHETEPSPAQDPPS